MHSNINKYIHPELKDDEVCLFNMDNEAFYNCDYRTKRKGTYTYNVRGELIDPQQSNFRPVFVKKWEVESFNYGWDEYGFINIFTKGGPEVLKQKDTV